MVPSYGASCYLLTTPLQVELLCYLLITPLQVELHYLYPNPHRPSYGASCYLVITPLQVELHPFNQQPQLLRYATEQVSGKLVAG